MSPQKAKRKEVVTGSLATTWRLVQMVHLILTTRKGKTELGYVLYSTQWHCDILVYCAEKKKKKQSNALKKKYSISIRISTGK